MNLRRLVQTHFGLHLTLQQCAALETYKQELLGWNQRVNLTAIREPEAVDAKHFLDSLSCLRVLGRRPEQRIVDVGTGAGFPGLVLKIACPSWEVTLVEAVGKKVAFCRHIVETLGLEGVEVLHTRAEELGHDPAHREAYDWAVARAVARLPILAEYLLPLVRVGGAMLAQKGETGPAEAQEAEYAIRVLGGELDRVVPVEVPGVAEDRYLIVVRKVAPTPARLPRRAGVPAKRPLLPPKKGA
ncbi:MAG TPA: 16S rRNA (guanine(527)-N(7))-methyltransferase RsmG [Anaerolineae bacterium]|nr:16S rRNA (guanine(527)-N(7))-methyltransferase RsmG [Anaerolineae bacterium]HID83771.1 16S rRNA (guanine(527)-N(7))-methyltransferase RsmG [Anaerolineales bacterium]HIQ09608.1 16S rRNA (guanine(527)-N(7))-methyltransferase RsmG [Anaerolineaceae bacterium]